MSTESWRLEENLLNVQVQITPLFCYACSRNFTDLDSFKNHQHHSTAKKEEDDNCDWLDLHIKTEELDDDEDLITWSPSNLFSELDNDTTTTTTTITRLPSTSTIKTNTSPLKSHNQNSQNVGNGFNSSEDRNKPKCLKGPDVIKILCYICHTRFMSLQKFLNHLQSPEANSHTLKCDKEESPQFNCSSKINYSNLDVDEDSSHSNCTLPSPIAQEEDKDEDENNEEDARNITHIEIEIDPLALNQDATDCPHCTKSFRKPSHLATHMRIFHTKSRHLHLNSDSNESDPDYQNQDENENDDQDVYLENLSTRKRRRLSSTKNERDDNNIQDSQCSKCLHVFHSPRELKRHLNGIKKLPQDCAACGLSFEWTCMYRKHGKEAHREKSGDKNDTKLGRTFSRKREFNLHTTIHTDEKSFECDEPGCNRRFPRKADLRLHKLRHVQAKPFSCSHDGCDKAFLRKKDLARHSTVHLPEKPFKCTFIDPKSKRPCERAFRNRSELRIHTNQHTGKIIFTCPESSCGQVWRDWSRLKHHVKTTHPVILGTLIRSQVMSRSENNEDNENNFNINEDSTSRMSMENENENGGGGENNNIYDVTFIINNEDKCRRFQCPYPDCSSAFQYKAMAERHYTIHMTEKPFKCNFIDPKSNFRCDRSFRAKYELDDHMNTHTGKIIYKCDHPGCNKIYREKNLFRFHIKTHDIKRKRPEPIQKISNDLNSTTDSEENEEDPEEEQEQEQEGPEEEEEEESTSSAPKERIKKYKCSILDCEKTFFSRNGLKLHKFSHLAEKPFKCTFILEDTEEVCGRTFRIADELKKHENEHTRQIRFECPHSDCEKVFYLKRGLGRHLKKVHLTPQQLEARRLKREREKAEMNSTGGRGEEKERNFKCPTCDAGFFNSRQRDRHTTVHLPEKPFKCDYLDPESGIICRRAFRIKSELTLHTNVHTKEKIFKCPHSNSTGCSETFWERRILTEHIRKKHGDEEEIIHGDARNSGFKCYEGDCNGKCFPYASSLKYHKERVHGFKAPLFMCESCGKILSKASTLKAHLKVVHEQEKNYLCTYCGAGFYSRSIFNRHVIVKHVNETPFHCETCGSQFRFQYKLTNHIAEIHNGQDLRKYVCDWNNGECGKSFGSRGRLRRHSYVHTGEKPYQCPVVGCAVAYPDPRPWKKHVKNAHPEYTEALVHPRFA